MENYKDEFANKVAIVTGAGQGMGKAVAERLAQGGSKIVVFDINSDQAEAAISSLNEYSSESMVVTGDVTKKEDVEKAVKDTVDRFGQVDILINNAGVLRPTAVIDIDEKEWDWVVAVNLKGTFLFSQAVLKIMRKNNWGRIVNFSSTAGKNISDWASGFKVETELPDLTTLVGQFSLKGLKGPSTDFPSFSSMGGFFDGVKLPNLSLPFSMPDINLPDINLPQIPSLPSIPGLGGGRGSGLFSGFSVNVPPFPKISIKNNPDLLDLFESIKNDTIGLVKAEAGFKQGLLGDNAGADGSFTNNVNPRSLTPKPSIWNNPQLPYKQLGTKYTDGIESKHPTESEDFDDSPKVSADFYPSTFNRGLPDLKTMLPSNTGNTLKEAGESYDSDTYVNIAQGEKYGLPFYFKDLRDNKYIIFRGYLSGIGQQVSPEWTPHSYLGRSEEVHVYSKAKRDINFTFKVYATTKPELQLIYEKLNQLTSMAYPQYREDIPSLKNRMKPPMCSLRIGELFGNDSIQGVTGFLNSLNFNWPDNSTWEIEHGKRVPKECDVTVGFTVVHKKPPHHSSPSSEFFGLGFK